MRHWLLYIVPAGFSLALFIVLSSVVGGTVTGTTEIAAVASLLATVALTPLWSAFALRLQGIPPRRADVDRALSEFTQAFNRIADVEPLIGEELGKLRETLDADRVALLLAEEEDGPFQIAGQRGYISDETRDLQLGRSSRLVKWLVVNECPLVLGKQTGVVDFLDEGDKNLLRRLRIDLIIPLTAMNRLVGLLLLGRAGDFGQNDLDLLTRLGPRLGLALQNVLLLRQSRLRLRRLYRTERLATVGQLAAGAAHEIRNPLTGIRSTIQYLRRDYQDDNQKRELVDELIAEVDRIDQIIAGLLSFARPSEPTLEEVDLGDLLRQTVHLAETTARKDRVDIALNLQDNQGPIAADPAQLKQVFLNLLMNAIQAMPDGGHLQIGLQPLGDGYRVEVADTGTGMPPEDLERAFDPFFTTKEEGTGLGLAICYGLISRHGGEIDIDSQVGTGTRVSVKL